jgi:SpoVK/Ycf46/Vps4 family AAA+-type ATPase
MMTETLTPPRPVQWSVGCGGYTTCGPTLPRLPAGAYTCAWDNFGNPLFQPKSLQLDDLIDFSGSLSSQILHEIDRFWTLGDRFQRYGFLHRRGYLFYGKQGGGKSSLIHQIVAKVVTSGQVAFFCVDPNCLIRCLEQFRVVEPDRPMVCIFEDIDALIQQWGDSALLQWLDGNFQVNKAVNIASTNYPERLDRRIISRPRRFDRILRIDAPDAGLRDGYFARKVPELSAAERAHWVKLTEGLQFAALAELVISVCCMDAGLEETVALLKKLDTHEPSSAEFFPDYSDVTAPVAAPEPVALAASTNGTVH